MQKALAVEGAGADSVEGFFVRESAVSGVLPPAVFGVSLVINAH